jgi:hypothetical protein
MRHVVGIGDPQPLNGVQGVAGSNPAPSVLDRLKDALADRYAIE